MKRFKNFKDGNEGIVGIHKLSLYDISNPQVLDLQNKISEILEIIKDPKLRHGHLQEIYKRMEELFSARQFVVKNIIPTVGRAVIAKWIIGDNTYDADVGVNYGSLGDDNTTPVNGNTTLGNEVFRKATSSVAQADNVCILTNFYAAGEGTGTIEEAGWHIDGTGSADTGQLLSHFLTGTITKAATETLTIESTITIS